jgi:hypothetical protein
VVIPADMIRELRRPTVPAKATIVDLTAGNTNSKEVPA